MSVLLADHAFLIEDSPLRSVRFILSNNLRINIYSSNVEQLQNVRTALNTLEINSGIHTDQNPYVSINIGANSVFNEEIANSIHTILDNFSDNFGNDMEISRRILDTLKQKGNNLRNTFTVIGAHLVGYAAAVNRAHSGFRLFDIQSSISNLQPASQTTSQRPTYTIQRPTYTISQVASVIDNRARSSKSWLTP